MPAERLSMRKIREILRLHSLGLSGRTIARSLAVSSSTVVDYLARAKVAGLGWPLPTDLDDEGLERQLFVQRQDHRRSRPEPDWSVIHAELRGKHVTLALLWDEYKRQHPEGYQYSQFCDRYRKWARTLEVSMRQEHCGGEKLFVDYSGDGLRWIDRETGEEHEAHLFVAALGASSYTYAEATATERLEDWLQCHVHAFEFLGGVTAVTVPDQARTAVEKTCRYDPTLNPAYQELALHYGTSVIPARPRKPRDKAKVEVTVLIVQRWILAALRHRTFYSLVEINRAVRELLERLNDRPMRKLNRSRRELFLELDLPHLRPLPQKAYQFAQWKCAVRVNVDYHVEFEKHYYSVPSQLVHQEVDVRATLSTVEIFHRHKRSASHPRSPIPHRHTTDRAHMPRSHQVHNEWPPSRIVNWAKETGPSTAALVERVMAERPHPEQGYRACLGIIRLAKRFTPERLEKACARALATKSHSYKAIESMLARRLEAEPLPVVSNLVLPPHENLRGSSYYQ